MQTRVDHEILLSLIDRSGLDDRGLQSLLGVHQTTLWRLRNGRIAKVGKYVRLLRERAREAPRGRDDELAENLVAVSRHSPALRALLEAIAAFMQEPA